MKEVAETAHLFLDNKFAYSGANSIDTTFKIDWSLFLGDLYKYKRFKLSLNGFTGWSSAASSAGYDARATMRLKGLPWCAGNSCGVYNTVLSSSNDVQMSYADVEAIVPSFITLPTAGVVLSSYNDSNSICFHRPPPGPTDFNITFQDCRSNGTFPGYATNSMVYNVSFTIIPLED